MLNPRLRCVSTAVWGWNREGKLYSVPRRRTVARSAQDTTDASYILWAFNVEKGNAHCSASRVFEALSSYPSPGYPPRAALRLPGVRERSPLRGYCGAQSLATFAALREIRVCVLCASREMWVCAVGCPPLGNCNGAVGFPRPLVWGRQQDWQESLKGFILY